MDEDPIEGVAALYTSICNTVAVALYSQSRCDVENGKGCSGHAKADSYLQRDREQD